MLETMNYTLKSECFVSLASPHVGGTPIFGVVILLEVTNDTSADRSIVLPMPKADAGQDAKPDTAEKLDACPPPQDGQVGLVYQRHHKGDDDEAHQHTHWNDAVVKVVPVARVVRDVEAHSVVNAHELEGDKGVGKNETAQKPHHVLLEHVFSLGEV